MSILLQFQKLPWDVCVCVYPQCPIPRYTPLIVPRITEFVPQCPIPRYTPLIVPQITEFVPPVFPFQGILHWFCPKLQNLYPPVSHSKVYSIDCAPNYWICTPSVPSQGILHWFCPKLLNLYPPVSHPSILLDFAPNYWICTPNFHLGIKSIVPQFPCIWTPVSHPKVCTSPNSLHLLHNVRSQGVVSCAPILFTAANCATPSFGSVNCTNKMWVSLLFYIPIWVR